MQKITPFLWYDHEAEDAAKFYVDIFSRKFPENTSLGRISRYGKATIEVSGKSAGSVMTVEFELVGQKFTTINGGPPFKLSEAVSFVITCTDQEEVDYYWEKLAEGGDEKAQICGWLKDNFGLSWQIVPEILSKYMQDPDPEKSDRVMKTFLSMKKIEIEKLKQAYES